MWRTNDGDRVLTEAEWAVFQSGLDWHRNATENDVQSETDDAETGVAVFDDLTPGYFLDTPLEPNGKGLLSARRTPAKLLGLRRMDEHGPHP